MSTTSTDPREIEADLERERASLASTLDALSDRVSVDNLAKEALGMLRSYSGTATTSIDHAVRANPLAVALIGAGVAWMFLGPKVIGSSSSKSSDYSSGYGSSSSAYDSSSSYRSSGSLGGQTSSRAYSGAYAGGLQHDDAAWAASGTRSSDYGRVGYVASDNDDDHAWSREAHGLRARAMDALHRIESEAKSYYESVRNGISNMTSGSGSQSRDFDAERDSVITRFSSDLKARFSAGLDNLPEGSREQVVAARERAYAAMLQAERMGRDAIRDPGRMMEEHPLVSGAIAFALGAAAGAALPGTEVENRTFGAERDRLMDDAARVLRQERETAMRVAGSVGSSVTQELKEAASETLQAVTETVTDKAQQAASRVTSRAGEELSHAQSGSSSGSSSSTMGGSSSLGGSSSVGGSSSIGGSTSGLRGPGDPTV